MSFGTAARVALATLALTVGVVGACQLPSDVELELGRRIVFEVPAADMAAAEAEIEAVARDFEGRTGAESIELRVRKVVGDVRDDGSGAEATMTATLDVWGTQLDVAALEQVLADHGIAADQAQDLALAGTVRTTLGDRLGHEWFDLDLDLDAMEVDEARQAILSSLEAQGFTGDAEVEVEDSDGHRRVEIRLRQPSAPQ